MRRSTMVLGIAGLLGLSGCGSDSPTQAPVTVSEGIHLKRVSPAELTVPSGVTSTILAWTHDTLSGPQVATVNDSLVVPSSAVSRTSLSLEVRLSEGANRFVLKLSDGTGIWYDTVTVVRGALPTAPVVSLLSPRRDTLHAWEDSVATVRWKLQGTLDTAILAGQVKLAASDSLVFRVVLRPGPDTLVLRGADIYGRRVSDTVYVKRGYYRGFADSLANLVVGKWQGDTTMTVPQAMRDSIAKSYNFAVDSALEVRDVMTMNADQTFSSRISLHFRASYLPMPSLVIDEWVDSVYLDQGTWRVDGDSLEITRTSCSKALTPYIRLVDQGALLDGDTTTHGLGASTNRTDVCSPVVSRTRIVLQGQAWPITVSGLLPGQDVAMRFVRIR